MLLRKHFRMLRSHCPSKRSSDQYAEDSNFGMSRSGRKRTKVVYREENEENIDSLNESYTKEVQKSTDGKSMAVFPGGELDATVRAKHEAFIQLGFDIFFFFSLFRFKHFFG